MSWPACTEEEIVKGIKEIEKEVLKTIEQLGMLPLLTAGNILRKDKEGAIIYLNPGMESKVTDTGFEPDELESVTVNELLELESDILCSTSDTNDHLYLYALSDIAASSAQAAASPETDQENDDDDDPRHCHLFQSGTSKYSDANFKGPKTTHWIGCDYQGCNNWFHKACLGLKFSSDVERETYALVCKSHDNIKELYNDRVIAKASDNSRVEEDEKMETSTPSKRPRRSEYQEGSSCSTMQATPPNYVEYEWEYYHIAKFLSLQQGKTYNPSTSRLARWMAVARTNFYKKVEKIISPIRSEGGVYLDNLASFWVPHVGLKCGKILRLVRKTSIKSTVPVFEWKKDQKATTDKVSVCFQVLSYKKIEHSKWLLTLTNEVMWTECDAHLLTFADAPKPRSWPVTVDAGSLEEIIPDLEKAEEERRREEEKLKEQEKEKRKTGEPENMTVRLLKEVLDDLNVTYRTNEKKADLIAKVREVRQNLQASTSQHSISPGHTDRRKSHFQDRVTFRACPFYYYYYDVFYTYYSHYFFSCKLLGYTLTRFYISKYVVFS